jgi:hypothetical protein
VGGFAGEEWSEGREFEAQKGQGVSGWLVAEQEASAGLGPEQVFGLGQAKRELELVSDLESQHLKRVLNEEGSGTKKRGKISNERKDLDSKLG